MNHTTVKSSTIFVAEGGKTQVFRSLDEMPADLRRRLEKSTNGIHSATILIADRRGRDEISRALNGLPTDFQSKVAAQVSGRSKPAGQRFSYAETFRYIGYTKLGRYWAPLCAGSAIAAAMWILFQYR